MISMLLSYAVLVGLGVVTLIVRRGRAIDRIALVAALGLCVALNPDRAAFTSVWQDTVTAARQAHGEVVGIAARDHRLVREDYVIFSLVTRAGKPVMLGALDRIVVLPTP